VASFYRKITEMILRPLCFKQLLAPLTIPVVLLLTHVSFAQDQDLTAEEVRIGVVDRQKIMRDSLAGEGVRQDFEALEQTFRDEISNKENGLRAQQEELNRQRAILTPEAFSERESKFAMRVEELQRDVAEINKQLDAMLQYGMRRIDMKTLQIIAEIADEKKYTLVLDKTQLLMVNTDYEFSGEVLTILNERLPKVEITLTEEAEE
jgi:outer membrane protein